MLSSLMPGWSPDHIKSRLHNYKRLVKPDVKEIGGAELRVALADIVNRVRPLSHLPAASRATPAAYINELFVTCCSAQQLGTVSEYTPEHFACYCWLVGMVMAMGAFGGSGSKVGCGCR